MANNQENLKPLTTEKAREIGRLGGIKSGEAKRERKLMSKIYADVLAKKHKVKDEEITGEDLLEKVILKVLSRGDSSSVSLIKEIREATEGNKMQLITDEEKTITVNIIPVKADGHTDTGKTTPDTDE